MKRLKSKTVQECFHCTKSGINNKNKKTSISAQNFTIGSSLMSTNLKNKAGYGLRLLDVLGNS